MNPGLHQKLLEANTLTLANIAQGAPLPLTLGRIANGIQEQHPEIAVAIFLMEEEGGHWRLGTALGLPDDYLHAMGRIATDTEAWMAQAAPEFIAIHIETGRFWSGFRSLAMQHGLHPREAAPIRSAAGQMLGMLIAYARKPDLDTVRLRPSIAAAKTLAAVAIERNSDAVRLSEAEKSLHERFTRMALAIDGSGTGIWDRNVVTGEIHYSTGWKALLGYADSEVTNRIEDSYQRVHPDHLAYVQEAMRAHFEQRTDSYEVTHKLRCKDGSYKWVSSRGKVVSRDDQGRALRMIGTTTDITVVRSMAERLQESVDLITSLTNQVPGLVFEYRRSPNGDGFFSYVSEGIRDIYEISPQQAVENAANIRLYIHPDDIARYHASFDASAASLSAWHIEYRVILPKRGLRWHQGDAHLRRLPDGGTQWHGFVTDITARKNAEEEMRLAALVYQSSSHAMVVTDAHGTIITVNPAFTQMTGYAPEEAIGRTPRILRSGRHDQAFYKAMWHEITTTGKWQGEIWDRRKDGSVYPKWLTINTTSAEDGAARRHVAHFYDMTEKKKSEEVIWRQANFDILTGLPNRQMFMDSLEHEIKKSHRTELSVALMFLDLDHFKEINDTLGHDMGDVLLKETAQRLARCVRDADMVARLGGDEFTIILGGQEEISSVERIAQDILCELAKPFHLGTEPVHVTTSIGIAFYPQDTQDVRTLIKNADQAMYAAKNQGGNCYHYFTPAIQEAAQTRMRLADDLRRALAENQFRLYYQPVVALATGKVCKAEALIRWQHPTRGLLVPADFIAVAEDTRLIMDIGDWVFREAARQAVHWRESHDKDFQVSVHMSPVQFDGDRACHIAWSECLRRLDLPGAGIVVEIVEGPLMQASDTVLDHLAGFRAAGMQLSLDDFGTGYSSLFYLKKFEIDYLKIDRSFVQMLTPEPEAMALSEAIIVMAHKLGIKVIAEGVETQEQRDLLAAAGCDYAQGFLYSRPLPAEQFGQFLRNGNVAALAACEMARPLNSP